MNPKYPNITVQLSGEEGNAFTIVGNVPRALKAAGVENSELKAFRNEAMSGDYDNLLRVCMKWVNVE